MAAYNRWTVSDVLTAVKLNTMIQQWGLDADKPTPTLVGQSYLATDILKLYISTNGSTWNYYVYVNLGEKDAANGLAGLNASGYVSPGRLYRDLELGTRCTISISEKVDVVDVWSQNNWAAQTDFDDRWVSQAGHIKSLYDNDLNEFKIANVVFNAGTYVIKVVTYTDVNMGILEVLVGATSLGTADQYTAVTVNNVVNSFSYSPTVRTVADMRFRCNGKNAASSNYQISVSRIQVMKTA